MLLTKAFISELQINASIITTININHHIMTQTSLFKYTMMIRMQFMISINAESSAASI